MLDWLKYCLIDLADFEERILIQTFYCKYGVNILTKIHPFDSLFSGVGSIDIVNIMELIELIVSQYQSESGENPLKLLPSDNIFSETVKIQEEFLDSDSFKGYLGLYFSHHFLNGKHFFR